MNTKVYANFDLYEVMQKSGLSKKIKTDKTIENNVRNKRRGKLSFVMMEKLLFGFFSCIIYMYILYLVWFCRQLDFCFFCFALPTKIGKQFLNHGQCNANFSSSKWKSMKKESIAVVCFRYLNIKY